MANIIASPTRYIQGKGELQNLRQHVEMLGKKLFILTTASGQARVAPAINASVAGSDCTAVYEPFHGECSQSEIDRVVADFQASGCDLIVGVGGGKTHDTAKAFTPWRSSHVRPAIRLATCPLLSHRTLFMTRSSARMRLVGNTRSSTLKRRMLICKPQRGLPRGRPLVAKIDTTEILYARKQI